MSTIYAFWKYDLFPFMLGAEIDIDRSGKRTDGRVYVPSYQGWVQPIQLIVGEAGKRLLADLDRLREDRREAENQLKEKFRAALVDRLNAAGVVHPADYVRLPERRTS